MKINRREFIALSATISGFGAMSSYAEEVTQNHAGRYVLYKTGINPDWAKMLERGIEEIGGIGKYIIQRSKVLIKPSIAWNKPPGTGFNSNPLLVKAVIELCFKVGAREVSLFDHTFDEWALAYKNSGIERIAKDNGGRIFPANDFSYYIPIDSAINKKRFHIHKAFAAADVIINLPATYLLNERPVNGSVFNYAGCLWERNSITENFEYLEALLSFRKPELTISEAGNLSHGNVQNKQALIFSPDLFYADIIAANWLNTGINRVAFLENAINKFRVNPDIDQTRTIHISG